MDSFQLDALNQNHVHIKNRQHVDNLIKGFIQGGKNKLQVSNFTTFSSLDWTLGLVQFVLFYSLNYSNTPPTILKSENQILLFKGLRTPWRFWEGLKWRNSPFQFSPAGWLSVHTYETELCLYHQNWMFFRNLQLFTSVWGLQILGNIVISNQYKKPVSLFFSRLPFIRICILVIGWSSTQRLIWLEILYSPLEGLTDLSKLDNCKCQQ